MKKLLCILIVAAFTAACNEQVVDEKKLNEAGEKLQKEVKKGVDTVGSKLKKLKNKVEKEIKDTTD